MSVFKTQSLLSIKLDTWDKQEDTKSALLAYLAAASEKKILYTKPDGTNGEWNAVLEDTKLVYNVADGDIDQDGTWELQAYIKVGGLKGYGDKISQRFEKPIS